MTISGGLKAFTKSRCLLADGASMSASSGDAASDRALDKNVITYWRSVGSSDSVTETLTITFPDDYEINRLFLVDINWKEFTAKYHNGSTYVDFANVIGLDGDPGSSIISETAFSDTTAYYEFDAVTTNSIQITVTKTQTADEEKYLGQVIACKEYGTFLGYPKIKIKHSRNERKKVALSGRSVIQKSETVMERMDIQLKDYPGSYSVDVALINTLFELDETFIVWACGGRRGSPYFQTEMRGFRLQDVYEVQISADVASSYSRNIYSGNTNTKLRLTEHV